MRITKLLSIVAVAALVTAPATAQRAPLTDAQVRDAVIRSSVNAYLATGIPVLAPTTQCAMGGLAADGAPTAGPAALPRSATRET